SCAHCLSHSFPTRRSSDLFRAFDGELPMIDSARRDRVLLMQALGILALSRLYPVPEQQGFEYVIRESHRLLQFQTAYELIQPARSEEHTSELQSRENLVCR